MKRKQWSILIMCSIVVTWLLIYFVAQFNNTAILIEKQPQLTLSKAIKDKQIIKNGQIYLPAESTILAFGATAHWNERKDQLTVSYQEKNSTVDLKQEKLVVDGAEIRANVTSFIQNDELFLPLEIIAPTVNKLITFQGETIVLQDLDQSFSDLKQGETSDFPKGFTKKIPVIMYHDFNSENQDGLKVHPDTFRAQMELLVQEGYTTLTDQDVIAIYEGKMKMPDKPIMITFDDGYRSNYIYAYPILKELQMKATIFIITDFIINPENHPSPFPKLSWEEMKEMSDSGVISFQSHTDNLHNKFNNIGEIVAPIQINGEWETQSEYEQRVLTDLARSKQILEEKLGKPITTLAYPFGHYSEDSEKLAKKAGFKMTITTDLGLIDPEKDQDLFLLKRVNIHGKSTAESILITIQKMKDLE